MDWTDPRPSPPPPHPRVTAARAAADRAERAFLVLDICRRVPAFPARATVRRAASAAPGARS